MARRVRVLISDTTDPWFNLATEDWIFRELDSDTHTLFLWRNADTIVIGRHQNPWVECKVKKMEEDHVTLARRQSGGGAVFHDLGNTNFTFLSSGAAYSQDTNFEIVIAALAQFRIRAERSGRNDILVGGRKVSGSAFKHTRERSFHHGTLLIHADLGRLQDYLTPHKKKLVGKGIKSVRSRVANLTEFVPELTHGLVCEAIMESFFTRHRGRCEPETLEADALGRIPSLREYYEKMADWDWRFGNTPDFSHHIEARLDWGRLDIHLEVHRGAITRSRVFSDALDVDMIETLQASLPGNRYTEEGLDAALDRTEQAHPDRRADLRDLRDRLRAEVG
ncbi:MAG: lipoate--protein ligase [Spirochaetales bacterium]|nr:lipoate--protein ligase [Spirochaetales bacterium]